MAVSETRTGWPLLIGSALLLAALQLWLRPLLPVDETRYLSVAWEMWWRADFLVPHLNGEAYHHKPPLLFWMIHGLWSVVGVSELAARLLPVGLSLIALWWSALLAGRVWPAYAVHVRALVPWLLFGGVFWINFYSLVQFDLLLVLAALGAWLGVWRSREQPLTGWLMVALGIGFGVLSKGPVILLPVLPALLFARWWMLSAPASWLRWYAGAGAAVLAGAALALAWAIPAGMAGGEAYQQAIFWGQSAGRMVQSFAHQAPWWSYLWWLPLMWLPWLLWPPVLKALARLRLDDEGVRFCFAVLLPALLLFSIISGKQGKYLLPLFPLVAMLIARVLAASADEAIRYRLYVAGALLALVGLALTLLPWWQGGPDWFAQVQLLWGPALLVYSLFWFRLQARLVAAVRALALAVWLGTATVYLGVLGLMAPRYELQPVAEQLAGLQQDGGVLAWLGKYHGQFHFLGRLTSPIEPLPGMPELHNWLAANPQGYLLVNYPEKLPNVPGDLQIWPYRSGTLVLWPSRRLRNLPDQLDALPGNA
jgi:4-amino-4-deoxy-L-arabinose transferase-like glycosyltransferase